MSRLKKIHQKYKNTGEENVCILNYHVYMQYYGSTVVLPTIFVHFGWHF